MGAKDGVLVEGIDLEETGPGAHHLDRLEGWDSLGQKRPDAGLELGVVDLQIPAVGILFRWRSDAADPVLQAFLEWGNIAALPQDVQEKIEVTARENLESYRDGGGYAFPHAVLLGTAVKPGSR